MAMTAESRLRIVRYSLFGLVALIHLILLIHLKFGLGHTEMRAEPETEVIKLVDFQEYVPPPPPEPKAEPKKDVTEVNDQPAAAEEIIEVEEEVVEVEVEAASPVRKEPEYLPQHKISLVPQIPTQEILDRIVYPPMALRQNKEAVVFVELYIDQTGLVRKVVVLKDPGYGFAEAAVNALEGLRCGPAEANGTPVAVRFRYPIRFVLH